MSQQRVSNRHAPLASVGELVRELLRCQDPVVYGDVLARYAFPTADLAPYLRWDPKHYTRTCVVRNSNFELLVICYGPGQRTSIHDYDSETAWVRTVMGEVVEERFQSEGDGGIRLRQASRLSTGEVVALERGNSIHRFSNAGMARAITLNLYAPPMNQWRVYDEQTGTAEMRMAGPPK